MTLRAHTSGCVFHEGKSDGASLREGTNEFGRTPAELPRQERRRNGRCLAFLLGMHYLLLFMAIILVPLGRFDFPSDGAGWFYAGVCGWEILTVAGTMWIALREGTA